ncbi:MAG TPA: restriction endonuclease subunit M [Prolixibacteraceae bacterium]|nr:restriction endonuclease subunit M [Prolixibacteraceae bacterium]
MLNNQQQFNQLVSFIWNIANDVLVHVFNKGDYKKVILPMMVLRRLDILLEPTKEAVLKQKEQLDKMGITNQSPVLMTITKYPFYNTSRFTMKTLTSETNPMRLKMNFLEYLDGYSRDVQDIIEKFKLKQQVDNLTENNRLGSILDKFTDSSVNLGINPIVDTEGNEVLPGVDNHMMGTVFEELLRKFNEENSVTEAGEHFTPRDYVHLLSDLAIIPIADKIESTTYSIYDGASGTGGILTISKEQIQSVAEKKNKKVQIHTFGQEFQPDTYATCKADIMISGELRQFSYTLNNQQRDYIAFGSTISQDGHRGETYDFCISNPPFGTPWKEDLKNWGLGEKEKDKITDARFKIQMEEGQEPISFIPGIGDPQMLFLANNISRMKSNTPLGTRIVEVHNGSSLFTGNAGGGESNLRQYIIENDLLEAIIAMPENDFYNTPIGTYIWIVTNRKEEHRRGKVQLIDATAIKTPLRKNLGKKNCETNKADRKKILNLLTHFEENAQSQIFPNAEFGFWEVTVERPLRQQVRIDKETLSSLVKRCLRMDVKFSNETVKELEGFGIDATYKDNIPVLEEDESIFSDRLLNERKVKLPKTIGQLTADVMMSEVMMILCDFAQQQSIYLNLQAFTDQFDTHKRANQYKLKFDKLSDFLYTLIEVDENAEPVTKNNKLIPNPALRDTEQVPFLYEGGISAFLQNEVLPYAPDAYVDYTKTKVGYKLSFTKYFSKSVERNRLNEIKSDLSDIQNNANNLRKLIMLEQSEINNVITRGINPKIQMKESGIDWVNQIPIHWNVRKIKYLFNERSQKGFPDEPILSATQIYGVIPQDLYENRVVVVNKGLEGLKLVEVGDFVISLRSFQGGIEYAYYKGIISAAYTILTPSKSLNSNYIKYLFKSLPFIELLKICVTGIREGQNINYDILRNKYLMLPPIDEQQQIVEYIESRVANIDEYISALKNEIVRMQEYKQCLISDAVTGKIKV